VTKFRNASLLTPREGVSNEGLVEEARLLSYSRSVERTNRRSFISSLGIAAGAAGMLGMTGCSDDGVVYENPSAPSVVDILNFALNLEYLEANFYLYVTTGSGLSSSDSGSGAGTVSGGAKLNFTNSFVATIAQNLAAEEQQHVEFLRSTITSLNATPVASPAINLAAMGSVTSDATFLALARQLETVGASAYAGGAQNLTSNTTALTYAAQILDTEAQHEGALRQACIALGVSSPAVDSLDSPPTSSSIFNTASSTGLNPIRTSSQVLQVVYGAVGKTGVSSGGFFPSGVNGSINMT
jgi:Ferritin-like domain